MSLFHKTDLIITTHKKSGIIGISEIGGEERREYNLGEGIHVIDIFVIGYPREGRFVVIKNTSIAVFEDVDIFNKVNKVKELKGNVGVRKIQKNSILKNEDDFFSFVSGCYLYDDWILLIFKKTANSDLSFVKFNISPSVIQQNPQVLDYRRKILNFTVPGALNKVEVFPLGSLSMMRNLVVLLTDKKLVVINSWKERLCFSDEVRNNHTTYYTYNNTNRMHRTNRKPLRSSVIKYNDICVFYGDHIIFGNFGIGKFKKKSTTNNSDLSLEFVKLFGDSEKLGKCSLLFECKEYILVLSRGSTVVKIVPTEFFEETTAKKKEKKKSFDVLPVSSLESLNNFSVLKSIRLPSSRNWAGYFFKKLQIFPLFDTHPFSDSKKLGRIDFKKGISGLVSIKSKKLRDEEMARIESVLEIVEKCSGDSLDEEEGEEEDGNPDFFPRDVNSLVYRYTFLNNKVIRIPKFLIDSLCFPLEGKEDPVFDFLTFPMNSIDEGFIIKFLILGKETKTRLTKDQLFELIFFCQKTRLLYHETLLYSSLYRLSTLDLLSLFEKCIRFLEKKDEMEIEKKADDDDEEEEEEEEEEDLQSFLLKSQEVKHFDKLKFCNLFTANVFVHLRSNTRVRIINKNRGFVRFLEKMGQLKNVSILHQSKIQKIQERYDYQTSYKRVVDDFYFISLSNGYDILVENLKLRMVDSSEKYESDVILKVENDSNNTIHLPKLALILYSNFFNKIFQYKMNMVENSNREVTIMGMPSFDLLMYFIGEYIFPALTKAPDFQDVYRVEHHLKLLLHCHMFQEDIHFAELLLELLRKMRELVTPNEISLKVFEMGFEFNCLPESLLKKIFQDSWSIKIDEKVIFRMIDYSKKMNDMVEKDKTKDAELNSLREKVGGLEKELNEFRKREKDDDEDEDIESERKRRKKE